MSGLICYNSDGITRLSQLYQWDRNITIVIRGFDCITQDAEVHFANKVCSDAIVVVPGVSDIDTTNKAIKTQIPNSVLKWSESIYIYIYDTKSDGVGTTYKICIPIVPRARVYDLKTVLRQYKPDEPETQTDYTLFLIESDGIDPKEAYRYTYPATSTMYRKDGLNGQPDTFAPLKKNGYTQAWKMFGDKTVERDINNDYYNATFLLTGDSVGIHRRSEWNSYISDIEQFFAPGNPPESKKMRIIESEDRSFYRIGEVTATIKEIEDYYALITIRAVLDGKKYERYHSAEPWVWDDFRFSDGFIRDYNDIAVSHESGSYMTLKIPVRTDDITPEFKRVSPTDEDNDVEVSIDGTAWESAAFEDYDDIDGITLPGSINTGEERELYLRGDGKHISIRMRVSSSI